MKKKTKECPFKGIVSSFWESINLCQNCIVSGYVPCQTKKKKGVGGADELDSSGGVR